MKDIKQNYEGCYGPILSVKEIADNLINAFRSDREAEINRPNERFSTVIWGPAGIGKTSLVRQLENINIQYRGVVYPNFRIVYLPLANIEEVGDIIGMPEKHICVIKDGVSKWVPETCLETYINRFGYSIDLSKGVKQFSAPPEWVPEADENGYCEPTIILVDDFNRANLRIMKACMPLFQTYATVGWKLPKGCHLVLTGNPSNQEFQVTDIDPAILTRMRHVTARFEIKDWVTWADGQGLIEEGIAFCSFYPEMMFGKLMTNPRTITEAFRMLKTCGINTSIQDDKSLEKVKNIISMLLDEEFVSAFITYLLDSERISISVEDVLTNKKKTSEIVKKLLSGKTKRIDVISIISERVFNAISKGYEFTNSRGENFHSFILDMGIPKDIVMSLLLRMNEASNISKCLKWMGDTRIRGMMSDYYRSTPS